MLRARVIARQLAYRESAGGLITAQAIVTAKLRNCASLLARFIRSRRRVGHTVDYLVGLHNKLLVDQKRVSATQDIKTLFLLEARAGRTWWQAIALICHLPDWQREYPRAHDPLNVLLNTGYTMLGRQCAKATEAAGLEPVIGVYHGESSARPLIWDLEEVFRQIAVDMVILPAYSRRSKSGVVSESRTYNKILGRLAWRYQEPMWYYGRCERLERIIVFEAVKLRRAIVGSKSYKPYHYHWGHRQKCEEKTAAPKG